MQCVWIEFRYRNCMSKIVCTIPIRKFCSWCCITHWPAKWNQQNQVKQIIEANIHFTSRLITYIFYIFKLSASNHLRTNGFVLKLEVGIPYKLTKVQKILICNISLKREERKLFKKIITGD